MSLDPPSNVSQSDNVLNIHSPVAGLIVNNKPERSRTGRICIFALKLITILIIASVLFYGAMTARWYSGDVVIKQDLVGEIVGRSAATAGPSPAWPGVEAAFARIDPIGSGLEPDVVHPGSEHWDVWMAYAEQHTADVATLRITMGHESLGYLASVIRRDGGGWVYDSPDEGPIPMETGLDLVTPLVTMSGTWRWLPRVLLIDAWYSIENNNPAAALDDMVAAIRYPGQSRESSYLISDMMAISSYSLAVQGVLRIVEAHGEAFTAVDLRRLRETNDGFMNGDIGFALDDERALSYDMAQRMFTNNGAGDGHAVVYYADYEIFDGQEPRFGREASLVGPIWLLIAPSRREFEAMTDRCIDAIRADMLAMPYQNQISEVDLLKAELDRSWQNQQRWNLHQMLLGGELFSLDTIVDRSRMIQSAASAVFALHEFRLDRGVWPTALAELVPDYLDQLPLDVYSGQPMLYRMDSDGAPSLYSVGQDGDDDQGAAVDENVDPWTSIVPDGDLVLWPPEPVVDDDY